MKQPIPQISKGPHSSDKYQRDIIVAVASSPSRTKTNRQYMELKHIADYIGVRSDNHSFKKYLKMCVEKMWLTEITDIKDKKNMFPRNSRIPKMLKGKRVFVLTEEGDHFHSSLTYAKYDNGMDMLKAYFHARTNEELAEKIRKTTFVPNFLKSYSKVYDD